MYAYEDEEPPLFIHPLVWHSSPLSPSISLIHSIERSRSLPLNYTTLNNRMDCSFMPSFHSFFPSELLFPYLFITTFKNIIFSYFCCLYLFVSIRVIFGHSACVENDSTGSFLSRRVQHQTKSP